MCNLYLDAVKYKHRSFSLSKMFFCHFDCTKKKTKMRKRGQKSRTTHQNAFQFDTAPSIGMARHENIW